MRTRSAVLCFFVGRSVVSSLSWGTEEENMMPSRPNLVKTQPGEDALQKMPFKRQVQEDAHLAAPALHVVVLVVLVVLGRLRGTGGVALLVVSVS